jgi:hypothetical protein
MSIWLAIPLAVGIIGVLIVVIARRTSGVTELHIDH